MTSSSRLGSRSPRLVEADRAAAEAQAPEADARRRFHEREDETWEYRNTFRHLTGEDQRRLIRLRGWPTDRYMKAVREDPKNPSRPRWSDDDVAAWEAARAMAH